MDVVGNGHAVHAAGVMPRGFPDRMKPDFTNTTQVIVEHKRYGKRPARLLHLRAGQEGQAKKAPDPETYRADQGVVAARKEFAPDEIIARCMVRW